MLFSQSVFLHCKLQYNHSTRKQILLHGRSGEETGQPSSGVFPPVRACRPQQMCTLAKKNICLLQGARLFLKSSEDTALCPLHLSHPSRSVHPTGPLTSCSLKEARGFCYLQRPCFLTTQELHIGRRWIFPCLSRTIRSQELVISCSSSTGRISVEVMGVATVPGH